MIDVESMNVDLENDIKEDTMSEDSDDDEHKEGQEYFVDEILDVTFRLKWLINDKGVGKWTAVTVNNIINNQ